MVHNEPRMKPRAGPRILTPIVIAATKYGDNVSREYANSRRNIEIPHDDNATMNQNNRSERSCYSPPRPRAKRSFASKRESKSFLEPCFAPLLVRGGTIETVGRGRNRYSYRNRAGFLCWPHCHRCKGYRGCRPPSDPFQRPTRRRKISPGPPWLFCSVSSAPSTSRLCSRLSCESFEPWTRSSFGEITEKKKEKRKINRRRPEIDSNFSRDSCNFFFLLYL